MSHTPLSTPARADHRPGTAAARTQSLAAVLRHLLEPDRERPARWLSPAFARAVDEEVASLRGVAGVAHLAALEPDADAVLDREAAASRLGRDPRDVAVAIRRLELAGGHRLPSWGTLVRRGLPPRPTDLDAALWFG